MSSIQQVGFESMSTWFERAEIHQEPGLKSQKNETSPDAMKETAATVL